MNNLILVAVGGSLGAIARYGTGLWAARILGKGFPWGTLIVNVLLLHHGHRGGNHAGPGSSYG